MNKNNKSQKFRYKNHLILLGLLLIAIFIRIFPIDRSYMFWDESVYLLHSEYSTTKQLPYSEFDIRPPIVPLLISIGPQFSIDREIFARIIIGTLCALIVIISYLMGKLFDEKTGYIAAIISAFFPYQILSSRWILTDSLAAILSGFAVYFFIKAVINNNNTIRDANISKKNNSSKRNMLFIFSGLFSGLAILTKFTSLLLIVVMAIVLFIFMYHKKSDTNKFKKSADSKLSISRSQLIYGLVIYFAAMIAVLIPYLIFNYTMFSNVLTPFVKGYSVINGSEPASVNFIFFSIAEFFGIYLLIFAIFLIIKAYKAYKNSKQDVNNEKNNLEMVFILWALFMLLYYAVIIQKGVAKPVGLEWETERFLLPAFIPVIVLCARFMTQIKLSTSQLALMILLGMLIGLPTIERAYTPAVQYESGLRALTLNVAEYAKTLPGDSIIYTNTNYPVIAYYSNIKTKSIQELYVNKDTFKDNYIVLFSMDDATKRFLENNTETILMRNHTLMQQSFLNSGNWTATIYSITS